MKEQKKKLNIKRVLWYYWQQMREQRVKLAVLLFFYTIGILIVEVVLPLIARDIIDTMSTFSVELVNREQLWLLFYILVGLTVAHEISFRAADYMIISFEIRVYRQLTHFVTNRLLLHSSVFFGNQFSGSLIAQAKRFIGNFTQLFEMFVFHLWWSGWKVPAIVITLFFLVPKIAAVFLVWMIIYGVVVFFLVRFGMPYDVKEATKDSLVTGRFSDIITNVLTVKMFARHDFERTTFAQTTLQQYNAQKKAWNFEITQILVQGVLFAILNIVSMYLSITLWLAGEMSIGTVVIVQLYISKIFGSLWPLGRVIKRFVKGIADAQEMVEIFDQDVDVKDPKSPEKSCMTNGIIVFDNVSFSYDGGQDHVLKDFSLTIPAGQKVGLVGTSGAGKSTVTKLLLRFADVTSGKITIDGQDVRNVTQDDLRSRIAYVPQEPLLFHRSIRENIAYARPEATDEEIVVAAQMAHAHGFIGALPEGYDTLVGERGIKLSGGERQRVAIARAILKDAPVLVMDEATSALDSVSEAHIQAAMEELVQGRTAIVVAHRLSTLKKMDRIIVMERGRIVEDGTHEELLAHGEQYATFWAQQAGGFVEDK